MDRLELGILGPLELRLGGATVPVDGVKPRQLLATLALHHGRTVSVDHLVEVLWPQEAPRSALANVQTYVSSLRALLGEHRLRRLPPGYRLELAEAELDALSFERHARGTDRPAIEQALRLWRGEPVENLPSSPLWSGEVSRLVELRRAARQQRARLCIEAGRPDEALEELRQLVAEDPLGEQAWLLLVTALRDAGQRAEALSAYAVARRTLTAELGVEPGEPLRRVHRTLLVEHGTSADTQRLDGAAAVVLRGLARLGATAVPAWVPAALLDRRDATEVIEALDRGRLLRPAGPDRLGRPRYGMPVLVGLLAPDLPGDGIEAALSRVLGGYLMLAERAGAGLPPQVFGPGLTVAARWPVPDADELTRDPIAWFAAERDGLLGAVAAAAATGLDDLAWELAHAMVAWFDLGGHTAEWEQTHRAALAACRAAGNPLGEAVTLRGLGQLHLYRDDYAHAGEAFSRSRLLFARLGNLHGLAAALAGLGTVHRVRDEFDEAYDCYEQALAAYTELAHRHGEAYAQGALGMVCLARGELAMAQHHFTAGLTIAEEIGDEHRTALLTRQLGLTRLRRGELSDARASLTSALDRFAGLGDSHCAAYCLTDLAGLEAPESAVDRLTTALEIFERIGDRRAQAQTAHRLGELHRGDGRHGLSDAYLAEARRLRATVDLS
ncbi:BTAD domain-containing putative transcriptional regulator [Catellatospora sp. KI3]|uniref:BTAD domain-containing putative transcriptional regulator n=1 Tax=Catellatospora sp. KI3 TaxID=3041620 RepID=UPI0024829B37|nr:BTAD domain-containing putative transcriptional regulator [Catellatospora sp. KI3]MDI1464393.1 BTAD domain-containing putative transcriptional regulator [Catellatospora sp. KI3]